MVVPDPGHISPTFGVAEADVMWPMACGGTLCTLWMALLSLIEPRIMKNPDNLASCDQTIRALRILQCESSLQDREPLTSRLMGEMICIFHTNVPSKCASCLPMGACTRAK